METNANESIHCSLMGVGLTKREYFAAMAMQGLATDNTISIELSVSLAVRLADNLIKELNKEMTWYHQDGV